MANSNYPFLVDVSSPEERGKRAERRLDGQSQPVILAIAVALFLAALGGAFVTLF